MREKINYLRLAIKTLLWILVISLVLVPVLNTSVGKLSLYNWLVPGRERFPFSDTPQKAYNLSLFNLDAMLASHKVSDMNGLNDEHRVFLLGDSSTWGTLLKPEDTLSGQLNQLELIAPDGKALHFYNLGYPTLSLAKDILLLQEAMKYDPDLIIWLVTLESFPADKQLISPLVENNPESIKPLFEELNLNPYLYGGEDLSPNYWDNTLFGQRRNLADVLRLQLYGIMWSLTGIDQYYPEDYKEAARDLSDDTTFHDWSLGEMTADHLSLELILAGRDIADRVPVILVNEPILISQGANSDLRYNFYYPRWAYDQYRDILNQFSIDQDIPYLDTWDLVPSQEFTNTAIHTTPEGVRMLVNELLPHIHAQFTP